MVAQQDMSLVGCQSLSHTHISIQISSDYYSYDSAAFKLACLVKLDCVMTDVYATQVWPSLEQAIGNIVTLARGTHLHACPIIWLTLSSFMGCLETCFNASMSRSVLTINEIPTPLSDVIPANNPPGLQTRWSLARGRWPCAGHGG